MASGDHCVDDVPDTKQRGHMIDVRKLCVSIFQGARRISPRLVQTTAGALFVSACLSASSVASAGNLERTIRFNIEANTLEEALVEFAEQAHVQLSVGSTPGLRLRRMENLKGAYTVQQGLAMLLSGTAFAFVEHGETLAIVPNGSLSSQARLGSSGPQDPVRNATVPATDPDPPEDSSSKKKKPAGSSPTAALQEVVVTGSHIRGAPPQSAPIIEFTREQIEDSGYPTLEQFMQSIPQNFASVGSTTIGLNDNTAVLNNGFGAGVDLRGLGPQSTLVLVNGQRIAAAGLTGQFTDISVIPLEAIKSIQILPSGASAIYGADAVGGVVNYVLRNSFNGVESTVEYGSVTRGSLKDIRASQAFGTTWSSGSGLLSYDYEDETPLLSSDREFSVNSAILDLTPEARQYGIFGAVQETPSSAVTLHGQILYANRHNDFTSAPSVSLPSLMSGALTKEYQGSLGADWSVTESWEVKGTLSDGDNATVFEQNGVTTSGNSRLLMASLGADGVLAKLRAGAVRAAIGTEVREERLSQFITVIGEQTVNRGRTVDAAFGQIIVPLLGPVAGRLRSSASRLELDAAARYDHYAEFGSSVNPDVGVSWRPAEGIRLRGTWASAFRPPALEDLYSGDDSALINSPDPLSASGRSAVLILIGGNPNLKPETSSQWTAGIDLEPSLVPGVTASLMYYDISYKNRIVSPNIPLFDALDSGAYYSTFIQRNPSPGELQALTSAPYAYFNYTGIPLPGFGPPRTLADTAAVANNELQNIGTTDTDGVDLTASMAGTAGPVRLTGSLDGTYILRFWEVPLPGAPGQGIVSTLYNPMNLRVRATLNASDGPVAGTVGANFYNHYVDNTNPSAPVPVSSWTTMDVQLRYSLRDAAHVPLGLGGLEVALSCSNCANRAPPGVSPASDPLGRGYDPTNANPLGRFLSLTLRYEW